MDQAAIPPLPLGNSQASSKNEWILWKWSAVAAVLLLTCFLWQCGSGMLAGSRFSDDAVHQFHARLDSEAYDDILRNSNEAFQGTDSRKNS